MTERTRSLSVGEFVDKLRRDDLKAPLTLTGMVKLAEDSSTQLMFAAGTRCDNWISVELNAIENVEILDVVPCDDHTHPLVTLTFKAPESPEGAMYAALLSGAARRQGTNLRVAQPLDRGVGRPILVRSARGSGVLTTTLSGHCTDVCATYEIDEAGQVFELYSCRDYGGGVYGCYYQ
ncbi:hypothetical protein [Nocardia anaemiae]|uniref:hypothetical protein n=1 Tax=Nocardia anaemiae TaxID=263910 RepID=UPI0007A3DEA2|nr:hypothetical protein [Nocardia anaemiae]